MREGAKRQEHVADIDFVGFYAPAFANFDEARAFVRLVQDIPSNRAAPRVLLYQSARMVWLGDRIEEFAAGRPALRILFYLIAAEAVAKVFHGYKKEGRSRPFVHRFFEEFCAPEHHQVLDAAFEYDLGGRYFSRRTAIDFLYKVRCDVVHEGRYYEFFLRDETGSDSPLVFHHNSMAVAHITIEALRKIVVEGTVRACRLLMASQSSSSSSVESPTATP